MKGLLKEFGDIPLFISDQFFIKEYKKITTKRTNNIFYIVSEA